MPSSPSRPAPNNIAAARKNKGLNQQQLADLVGSHWITISKLERGVMRLTDEWRDKIGEALKVDPWSLVAVQRPLPTAPVTGRIFDDGSIVDITEEALHVNLSTNFFVHPQYSWLEVGDEGLWPFYQKGDVLCVLELEEDEVDDHIGRLCVGWYGPQDQGNWDVSIGVLERGAHSGIYTIMRYGVGPVRDVKLHALHVVAMAVYDVAKSREEKI